VTEPPLSLRCPRCKQQLTGPDEPTLADRMLEHLAAVHGHQPPRDHVVARIRRHNET
jgi:hypothetical protein